MRALARLALVALLFASLFAARPARSETPRVEAAAKDALTKAEDAYLALAFTRGLVLLRKAERACGDERCTTATHAALVRDIGTFLFRAGDEAGARAAFTRALKLDPSIALNPSYDAKDLRARWTAAKDALLASTQPGEGDFVHVPPREQKETVPLPIYVEYRGTAALASVIVKYRSDAMPAYSRLVLRRVGNGWGGYVPCANVTLGVLRYYVQGLDAADLPILSSGSPRAPFSVPIRAALSGEAPSLPGEPAPETCTDDALRTLHLAIGERCLQDSQCETGTCTAGRCARAPEIENLEGAHARFWIGVAGSAELAFVSAGSDVCKRSAAAPAFYCTNPDGTDFPTVPQNDALIANRAGQVAGGATGGDARVLLTLDYATSPNLLVGLRLGYVAQSYSGQVGIDEGRVPKFAFHGEARGTYLFGTDPLSVAGLVPYASLGAGYARFDAATRVTVASQNIAGERAVQAWAVGGPFFASVGTGLRYALSPRIGFSIGARCAVAFGAGGVLTTVGPEAALQYGF